MKKPLLFIAGGTLLIAGSEVTRNVLTFVDNEAIKILSVSSLVGLSTYVILNMKNT